MTKAQALVNNLLGENARQAAKDWLNRVDPDDARDAIRVELERTSDYDRAKTVALDNLAKDPGYYKKLNKLGLRGTHKNSPQSIRY